MIRLSAEEDLPFLTAVERSAAQIFVRHFDNDTSCAERTLAPETLLESHRNESLWVALDAETIVAFLAATNIDAGFHIQEISVAFDHQGRGIGEKLVQALVAEANRRNHGQISLTTDRRLPWSRHLYRKLGFQECPLENCPADLADILRRDKKASPVVEDRIAMILGV
ncbi:MAG: GNAT family N-acetyltransferase [Sneathiella sp.]